MEVIADSVVAQDSPTWSRIRWVLLILAMFGIHLGLVFFLSRQQDGLEPKRSDAGSFRLVAGTPQEALVSRGLSLLNPALFGSASGQTFSGLAWIRHPTLEFQLPSWTEPPAYLQLPEKVWFSPPAPDSAAPENSFAEKLAPLTTLPKLDHLPPRSQLFIDQLPGGRPLVYAAEITVQPHTDILSSSLVEAAVDTHGAVISARLLSRSGSKKADEDALATSRLVRFRPVYPSDYPSGKSPSVDCAILRFQWFTVGPEQGLGIKN